VLAYWDGLSAQERARLASQIRRVDWDRLDRWSQKLNDDAAPLPPADRIEPAPYFPLVPEDEAAAAAYVEAESAGRDLIRSGKVACFTVAGGQGTRLGYDAPKGTYPISPVGGRSLFQIFAESIGRAREKYSAALPWFVMTSPLNDADTRVFFAENDYFDLDPTSVHFFEQGTLPAVSADGKVLLAERGALALSPNGHGGSLSALRDSGALERMADLGVEFISYWQVDNPLVYILDPLFLGLNAVHGSEMGSRSLTKAYAEEKLGNFVLVDGHLRIIEYSDMPDDLLNAMDDRGRLRFRAGSPAIHVLAAPFVQRLTEHGLDLEPHVAFKKVPHIGPDGNLVEPSEPNAYKFEYFIFDALPRARNPIIVEVSREEQFAPVKNPSGPDSVESCRDLWLARDARWLEAAGKDVPRDADGRPAAAVELSRRSFLDPEDVRDAADRLTVPPPGTRRILS
jgi:UDP-N-acetylglucosamine/UDP-N-acetylgalactosamine diphosphorylase